MPNKDGHRRFGSIRRLPSGRYQVRYRAPDGQARSHPQTYERKAEAERALSPQAIVPDLRDHLARFVQPGADALVFPGYKGGPLRRGNFNRSAGWPQAVAGIGAPGLHFHDLRHTGNTFAAATGAGLKDLMARMGHDSERAAIIYQHLARGADAAITNAIDAYVDRERRHGDDDDGSAGVLAPVG